MSSRVLQGGSDGALAEGFGHILRAGRCDWCSMSQSTASDGVLAAATRGGAESTASLRRLLLWRRERGRCQLGVVHLGGFMRMLGASAEWIMLNDALGVDGLVTRVVEHFWKAHTAGDLCCDGRR